MQKCMSQPDKAMKEQRGGGVFSKIGLEINLHIGRLNRNREELNKIETSFSGLYVTTGSVICLY